MPVPIICLDESLRQFAERFRQELSKPPYQYFVIVLLGLMRMSKQGERCKGCCVRLRMDRVWQVEPFSLARPQGSRQLWLKSGLPTFGSRCSLRWQRKCSDNAASTQNVKAVPNCLSDHPYLIGDDSTIEKRKGKKMEGLGRHHSTTEDKRVTGHSLVESLYVLLGRRCPLASQLYRQQAVCAAEGVLFASKIDLMESVIRTFEPVAGTVTHVLLDTWYSAKRLWQAARERGFLMTSGLKSNRWLRVEDPSAPQGWAWQRLSDYTAQLSTTDYIQGKWPKGEEDVYVHVVSTRVRKLYSCQVVIVRQSLDAPLS